MQKNTPSRGNIGRIEAFFCICQPLAGIWVYNSPQQLLTCFYNPFLRNLSMMSYIIQTRTQRLGTCCRHSEFAVRRLPILPEH
jgi:hypothetical protein